MPNEQAKLADGPGRVHYVLALRGRRSVTPRPDVVLYTRVGCHLCDVAKGILERAGRRIVFDLTVVDVDTDDELRARFGDEVPVVFVNGRKAFKHRLDPALLERKLTEI